MFRLDEDRVVDATLSGGLARYINHSCNPNCVAEIVEVERDLRIIIFAKRRISRGEEVGTIVAINFLDLLRFKY
jgi:histone-lysine N-methyltransferase MLL3